MSECGNFMNANEWNSPLLQQSCCGVFTLAGIGTGTGNKWVVEALTSHPNKDRAQDLLSPIVLVRIPIIVSVPVPLSVNTPLKLFRNIYGWLTHKVYFHCGSCAVRTFWFALINGVFALPDSDSYAGTDSSTEKVTKDANGMTPRLVLNGYRTHLSQSRSQSRSSGSTSRQYH